MPERKERVAMAVCLPHPMETGVELLLPLCSSAAHPKAFEMLGQDAIKEGACSHQNASVPVHLEPLAIEYKGGSSTTHPHLSFFTLSLQLGQWQFGSFCGSWDSEGPDTSQMVHLIHRYPSTTVPLIHTYPSTQVPQPMVHDSQIP